MLNAANNVMSFRGAGCAASHAELLETAAKLKAPIVHALRGKEFIAYDNPYDDQRINILSTQTAVFQFTLTCSY
jgi:thiamine pyrophosphate-dependent acetolactate synthase large subunit-like protein